jgi:hypothetical protein
MKTKRLLLVILFAIANNAIFAQLKINQYGRLGMGIEPHPSYKLLIKGNLCLTTHPEIPFPNTNPTELFFKVGNGYPGAEIGCTDMDNTIAFYSSDQGYCTLYAAHYYTGSDSTIKTNILPIQNALEKILQIESYSFNLKRGSNVESNASYGFLAQEIKNVLPNIIDTGKGIMLIDYQQVIPLLVEALKEQQKEIDSLKNDTTIIQNRSLAKPENVNTNIIDSIKNELENLKMQMQYCCEQKQLKTSKEIEINYPTSILYQNKPNPFKENTIIEFDIKEDFKDASIMVFDMQGLLKRSIPITKNGKGRIIINGNELSAGMYLYSLIINENEIDTKRMILLN